MQFREEATTECVIQTRASSSAVLFDLIVWILRVTAILPEPRHSDFHLRLFGCGGSSSGGQQFGSPTARPVP